MMIPGQREPNRRPDPEPGGPAVTAGVEHAVALPHPASIAAPAAPWSELPTWLEVSIVGTLLVVMMVLAMWTAGR